MSSTTPAFTDAQHAIIHGLRSCFGDEISELMLRHAGSHEQQCSMLASYAAMQSSAVESASDLVKAAANAHLDMVRQETNSQVAMLQQEMNAQLAQAQEEHNALSQRLMTALTVQESLTAALQAGHSSRPHESSRAIRLPVPSYEGKSTENFIRWIMKVEMAADAQRISTDAARINFAMAHLTGHAESWAFTLRQANEECFADWSDFVDQMRATFSPPNSEYQYRSKFIACKQGSRTLQAYIEDLRALAACLSKSNSLTEDMKVTVFMDGLSKSSARTQLFRVYPKTLEEAFQVALREEFSVRAASSAAAKQSDDMDISLIRAELNAVRMQLNTQRDMSKVTCFRCGKPGHMKSMCRVRLRFDLPADGRSSGHSERQGNVSPQ
jgi:hypothetical protein